MDRQLAEKLERMAKEARGRAYAPYSRFKVGAALLGASGRIYQGCNVENASYGAAICAERGAVCAAVAAGERSFAAICIAAGEEETFPCGICRQVLSEFSPEMLVLCTSGHGVRSYVLRDLLPHSFAGFQPGRD